MPSILRIRQLSCKTTDYACKIKELRVQDFTTGENFCLSQCYNKEFCVFSPES